MLSCMCPVSSRAFLGQVSELCNSWDLLANGGADPIILFKLSISAMLFSGGYRGVAMVSAETPSERARAPNQYREEQKSP